MLEYYHTLNGFFVDTAMFWILGLYINQRVMDRNITREVDRMIAKIDEHTDQLAKLN